MSTQFSSCRARNRPLTASIPPFAAKKGSQVDTLVALDPRFAPAHAGYYIEGLRQHTGGEPLPGTTAGFPGSYSDNKPLAFILQRDGRRRNVYIAADDMPEIDLAALEWADVYGKVNLDWDSVPQQVEHQVVPIGPSHRLRAWTLSGTVRMAIATHRNGGRIVPTTREHYKEFWKLYRRALGSEHYEPGQAEDDYVFFNAWLWRKHGDVNPRRAEFIKSCMELDGIRFEGGFIARRRNDMPEYADYVADRKYPLSEFLANIKRSAVVFNNPAVHRCHGWKLGEFLRLGKAVLSLPLERELPAPLVHGHHVHFVEGGKEAIKAAIAQIVGDPDYRRHLEAGARRYYEEHLAPGTVIARLADMAFGDTQVRQAL